MRSVLAFLAVMAASPALALSCLAPDPLRSFQEAAAAPETYVVLLGRLDFDPALMPEGGYQDRQDGDDPAPVPARFQGQGLGPGGFAPSSVGALTLRPTCAGPWCGSVEPAGGEWLLFARQVPGGWEVEVGPCGGMIFERPAQAVLDRLAACMGGEACEAP